MARFDAKLWKPIAEKFRAVRRELDPAGSPESFTARHGMGGIKWRFIEQNKQGTSIESLIAVCEKFQLSPSWLILGLGPRSLSDLPPDRAQRSQEGDPLPQRAYDSLNRQILNALEETRVPDATERYEEKPRPKAAGKIGARVSAPAKKGRLQGDKRRKGE